MNTAKNTQQTNFTAIEICAGAGGQALGLEQAGFSHLALVEVDKHCCNTLRLNRPDWPVHEIDVREFNASPFKNQVDLLAGGIPCPPFSVAGKQLGVDDERNLMPELLRLTKECNPKVVLLENVPGLLQSNFDEYRTEINESFKQLGYTSQWKKLISSDYGVSQLRPRAIMIAVHESIQNIFNWPTENENPAPTVGKLLVELMAADGWKKSTEWSERANKIAPTIVGGSKKHGGPDLGPTRAKKAWAELGVNGKLVAYEPPAQDFVGDPYLTVPMVARIQGFPIEWKFSGKKTPAYRQVGNAFPPPVAQAVGRSIINLLKKDQIQQQTVYQHHEKTISQRQIAGTLSQ